MGDGGYGGPMFGGPEMGAAGPWTYDTEVVEDVNGFQAMEQARGGGGGGAFRGRGRGDGFRGRGRGEGFRGRGRGGRGGFRGRGGQVQMGPPKILKPEGGDWKNAFNPDIFKKKVADLKEASKKTDVPHLDKDSKKTDAKIAELKKAGTVKDSKAGPSQKKTDLKNPNFKNADESIAAIMKMVEDEKVNDELKRAQEEVESYRYPNETVAEFEKNIVFRHNDNVTQWVNEFSKKRGWFVQVRNKAFSGLKGCREV